MAKSDVNEILLQLKMENEQLKTKLTESEGKIDNLEKKVSRSGSNIGGVFKKIGGLIATYMGVQAVRAFVNLAGEVDSVSSSFYSMAKGAEGGADGLLQAMQAASKGTVDNLSIMRSANLAFQLMGDQVADQLPKMMEVAMAAAKTQGKKTADMFNDIVVASGRQSVMILDNLGISSVTAGKYMEQFANSIGKTRDQLNDAQKSQAFFYAVMQAGQELIKKSGGSTLTFGQRLQIVDARMKNAAQSATQIMLPALENLLEAFTDINTGGGNIFTGLVKQVAHFVNYFGYAIKQIDAWWNKTSDADKMNEKYLSHAMDRIKELKAQIRDMAATTSYGSAGYMKMAADIKSTSKNFTDLGAAVKKGFTMEQIELVKSYNATLISASKTANSTMSSTEIYNNKLKQIEEDYQRRQKEIDAGGAKRDTDRMARQQQMAEQTKKEYEEMMNARATYYEYTDQYVQAELVREQIKYEQLLQLQTGFQKNETAMRTAYEKKKLLAEVNGNKEKMKSDVAYHQAKLGLMTAEWEAFKEITNYGTTLMRSHSKILFNVGKALAYAQAVMNAAEAVTKIWAQWGWPWGAIFSGVAIAATGVEIAAISNTKMPSYEKGRVPVLAEGYIPSDHFPAFIGAKEAVMTERATAANTDVLAEMNRTGEKVTGEQTVIVNQNVNISGNVMSRDFVIDHVLPELKTQARYQGKELFAERS